jgi:hypothetical protein
MVIHREKQELYSLFFLFERTWKLFPEELSGSSSTPSPSLKFTIGLGWPGEPVPKPS